MYALKIYIKKSVFGKKNLRIEKTIKTFSKNSILSCALRAHVSKILIKIVSN